MTTKNFKEMADSELQKSLKTSTIITGLLAGVLAILFIINLIIDKKGWTAVSIPLALIPIVIINYNNIIEMREELKIRKK
jgi:uncharacterized membrane protein